VNQSQRIVFWYGGGAAKTRVLAVERAQRAALKVLYRKPFRYPTFQLYQEASVLTVRQFYILKTILRQHSIPPTLPDKNRRRKIIYPVLPCKTTFAKRQLPVASHRIYNKVDSKIEIGSLNRHNCKNKSKEWLLSLNYSDTEDLIV
jgi:hypothetical protein